MTTACPSRQQLIHFLSGRLSDSEFAAFEAHLADCGPCGDTVRGLNVHDTLFDLARGPAPADPPDPEVIQRLIRRLRDLPSPPSDALPRQDAQARADEVAQKLDPPELPGEIGRLAHYRATELLGAGGMGVVYQADDVQLRRKVALKVLRPSLGIAARDRFVREAQAAAAIEHDHVVTIYQVGQTDSLAYIAMQWLDGETLEARLHRDGCLPIEEALEIVRQVASGLDAAHMKNLIHRDIKPANIWLEADRTRARILDFGLARTVDDDPQLTETGMIAGTPAYMSPEQAQGGPVDNRTDLFSLGCVMYRMLTGQMPFHASNALATLQVIQRDEPVAPAEINSQIPRPLSDVVMWLLEKEPTQRPRRALELCEVLARPIDDMKAPRPARRKPETRRVNVSRGSWISRSVAIALLVGLGLAGYAAAPFVIRVATNRGQLVIKTEDPNIKVEITQGGEKVRVIDLRDQHAVDLTAGEYGLQIAGDAGGFRLSRGKIVVTRGSRATVEISHDFQAPGALAQQDGGASNAERIPNSSGPTYDGKTLDAWLSMARRERSLTQLYDVTTALGYLGQDEDSERCAREVLGIMRTHGRRFYQPNARTSVDRLNMAATAALFRISPAGALRAIRHELSAGTWPSRHFLIGLLSAWQEGAPGVEQEQVDRLMAEFGAIAKPLATELLDAAGQSDSQVAAWNVEMLALLCEATQLDYDSVDHLIPRLQQELEQEQPSFAVLQSLVRCAPETPGLARHLGAALSEQRVQNHALRLIDQLGPRAGEALPGLIQILPSALKAYRKPPFPGGATRILNTLANLGPLAHDAIPTLDQMIANRTVPGQMLKTIEQTRKRIQDAVGPPSKPRGDGSKTIEPMDLELRVVADAGPENVDGSTKAYLVHPNARLAMPADSWQFTSRDGRRHLLLSSAAEDGIMLQQNQESGKVIAAALHRDQDGSTSLHLTVDPAGADKLSDFSWRNVDRHVAVLVGGQVVMAPVRSTISDHVSITGSFSVQDWEALTAIGSQQADKMVEAELVRLLQMAERSFKAARARHSAGLGGRYEYLISLVHVLDAKAKLAKHRGQTSALRKHLTELADTCDKAAQAARQLHGADQRLSEFEVHQVERALIDARIRLRQLGPDPASAPATAGDQAEP